MKKFLSQILDKKDMAQYQGAITAAETAYEVVNAISNNPKVQKAIETVVFGN